MIMKNYLLLFYLVTTVSALGIDRRQASSRSPSDPVTRQPFFPFGPQKDNSSLESTIPIECVEGCYVPAGSYM